MNHNEHWIVTADSRRAVLFVCRRLPSGDLHLEQLRAIEHAPVTEHEHHRPTLMGGAERVGARDRSSVHAAPHASSSEGHEVEEEQRRFAREFKEWLDDVCRERIVRTEAGRITVFATPRMMAILESALGKHRGQVDLVRGELVNLSAQQLMQHPAVKAALHDWLAVPAR